MVDCLGILGIAKQRAGGVVLSKFRYCGAVGNFALPSVQNTVS